MEVITEKVTVDWGLEEWSGGVRKPTFQFEATV